MKHNETFDRKLAIEKSSFPKKVTLADLIRRKKTMNFVYRNLKALVYLGMVVAAIAIGTFQISHFYQSKKFVKTVDEIGFLTSMGKNFLVKNRTTKKQFIPTHGAPYFSGDAILTYDHVVDLELPVPYDKIRILPYSEVIVEQKKNRIEVYINTGEVSILSRQGKDSIQSQFMSLYKKNQSDGQYYDYNATVSNLVSGTYLHLTEINQKLSPQGPKIQLKWDAAKLKSNAWVELWIGQSRNHLALFKNYPFEQGSLTEHISSDQFYWMIKVKGGDQILESSPTSFWKNDFKSQVNLLYPNDSEVINDFLKSDNLTFKWAQAQNVENAVLKIYRDEAQTQVLTELKVSQKNFTKYTPPDYGHYYWKIVDDSQKIQSELRSFYYAPIVSSTEEVTKWDSTCEDMQFYYDKPVVYLKWNKTYNYPINKYKVTFQYFQNVQGSENLTGKTENIFTDKAEMFFLVRSASPVKVRIQAYNSKMQRLGKAIEKTIDLAPRGKAKVLVFLNEKLPKKKTLVSDRNYSLIVDPNSISALYKYGYTVATLRGEKVRTGAIYKGQNVNLRGLPIDYYNIDFTIEPRTMALLLESQFLDEMKNSRTPASQNTLNLSQSAQIKLIPPVDFNLVPQASSGKRNPDSTGKIIKPQVPDVRLKD